MDTGEPIKRTSQAYIWTNVFKAPFWALYVLLIFILQKDLRATPLQISILIALKPVLSIFSIYWSDFIHKRPDRLRMNLILGGLIGHIPFFFFPIIDHPWFIVISGALYMMFSRGILPAWTEILKLNLPRTKLESIFSYGLTISYVGGLVFPIIFGKWMDLEPGIWRLLFPCSAFLSLFGMIFQWRIPINISPETKEKFTIKITEIAARPWKNTWKLCKSRSDFAWFQIGFMLGGGGLMIMQPALPVFCCELLKMSYTELAIALSICKGIGFAATSKIWANYFSRISIYRFSSYVTLLSALFPLGILLAQMNLLWIYAAFVIYGIMQAGSELSWHISGAIFAKDEDSSMYSSVNVVTVGLRGIFAPFIGSLICGSISASFALLIGSIFCLLASVQLRLSHRAYAQQNK